MCFCTTWQNGETRKSHFSLKCCISSLKCCISPERRGSTSDRRAATRPHYADLTTAPLAARTPTSRFQDRRPGLSVSDRPGIRVSGRRLSAYFRRQYVPTPIDRHSDLRRPAFKQLLRRPVFCSCRTTSVEHVASTATAL